MSCKYCDFTRPSQTFNDMYAHPLIRNPYGWDVVLRRNKRGIAQIVSKDHYTDTSYMVAIKNCPMCGREL